MNYSWNIFQNYPLVCAGLGWCIAQLLKVIINLITNKKFSILLLLSSGGMPSSHSATVCALTAAMGRTAGLLSNEFAICFILAFIVMYDAAGVRRAAGEQAKLLNRLARSLEEGSADNVYKELKELIGHTPLEVCAGAVLGIAIPFIFKC